MKVKLSISMDKETVKQIENELAAGLFRNKSHLIEYLVNSHFMKKGGLKWG